MSIDHEGASSTTRSRARSGSTDTNKSGASAARAHAERRERDSGNSAASSLADAPRDSGDWRDNYGHGYGQRYQAHAQGDLVRYPGNLLRSGQSNGNPVSDDYCAYLSKELKSYQDLTLRLTKQLQAAQTKIDALQ